MTETIHLDKTGDDHPACGTRHCHWSSTAPADVTCRRCLAIAGTGQLALFTLDCL